MPLPTNYGDSWWLVKAEPKDNITKITNPETGEALKFIRQSVWTVVIARTRFRVTSLESEIGSKRASFNVKTGPDSSVAISWTGKKFVCTADILTLDDAESGTCRQEQTWMHYSRLEEVDPDEFIGG